MTMQPGGSPSRFITRLNSVRTQLSRCGEVISDEKFIYDILARLTASEYTEVGQRIQEKLQPREAAYKRRSKLTPEQIETVAN